MARNDVTHNDLIIDNEEVEKLSEEELDRPREGYVPLPKENVPSREMTEVDEVVLEAMPEIDKKINEAGLKDTGFGQEWDVVINETGDRMAKYKDNLEG